MRTLLRRCPSCPRYTLRDACPRCGGAVRVPVPSRFSPEDTYGEYRRRLLRQSRPGTPTPKTPAGPGGGSG